VSNTAFVLEEEEEEQQRFGFRGAKTKAADTTLEAMADCSLKLE
jgi:hypothetical protein